MTKTPSKLEAQEKGIALYHVVRSHEGFNDAAQALFKLVQDAEVRYPGRPRLLFLDIEGHRNDEGGFDADMLELQRDFLIGFLGRFLTEIHAPLVNATRAEPQDNEIPPALIVGDQTEAKTT